MAKDFIVAIELGSSKITAIAGKKNFNESLSILAVVQEESSDFIRRGAIYNIDKTTAALLSVKHRLETLLNNKVSQAYVGLGGQSIVGLENVITKELPQGTIVSQEMVDELMDANRNMDYPERMILDAVVLEYKVDNIASMDPVGIQCSRLEGHFLNILQRTTFYNNITRCFADAGIRIVDRLIAPLTLADSLLVEADRRAGCLLVDLGAATTTLALYHRNILRHVAVLPLGGDNITHDIASYSIEETDAERMKKEFGCAYADNNDIKEELPIDGERKIDGRKFIETIEDRVEEIVMNVQAQVPDNYMSKLIAGVVLTGGGANMKNIDKAFSTYMHIDKVRIAKIVTQPIDATIHEINEWDGRLNTAISLLAQGNVNCAGGPLDRGLFDQPEDDGPDHELPEPEPPKKDENVPEDEGEKKSRLRRWFEDAGNFFNSIFAYDDKDE